jgi:hypothetical protein
MSGRRTTRRSDSAIRGALECRRQQLHNLSDRRHTGRGPCSTNLANIGIGHGAIDGGVGYTYVDEKTGHEFSAVTGLTGKLCEHLDQLHQRDRLASRLGPVAISNQTMAGRPGRIFLRSAHSRQRLRPGHMSIRVARHRRRPANRIPVSGRRHAGLPEPQGLWRIRQ